MFQYSLFFFIKLKFIYKFKGRYNPLTQAADNILYKKIIFIHTQTIALYSLKYILSKTHFLYLPPTCEPTFVNPPLVAFPFSDILIQGT